MNNLTIFKNEMFGEIRVLYFNDEIYFVGRDVAHVLGYKEPHKAIVRHCKHGIKHPIPDATGTEQATYIIPEGDVYRLIIKSKLTQAEQFEEWVMDDVLPSLRKNNCYITESATQEDIDFESLYGKNRIYDTFFNADDVHFEYDRFCELAKQKRNKNHHAFNNQDRIKLSKKIVEALENKARYAIASRQPMSKILSYQELQTKVQIDITRLSNKHNGGLRAQVTRKLNKLQTDYDTLFFEFNELKTQYEEVQDTTMNDILFRQGENKEYLVIPYRGFSNNDMYRVKNNAMKRTPAYNFYENNFPKYLLRNKTFTEGLDLSKPMACELLYDHTKGYDVHNFIKATLDIVSRTMGFNDRLIRRVSCATHEIVEDNYSNGKIYIKLYNIE